MGTHAYYLKETKSGKGMGNLGKFDVRNNVVLLSFWFQLWQIVKV